VLLVVNGRSIGAVTLERTEENPFDPDKVRLCEQIALLLAPVLDLKQRDERGLPSRVWDAFSEGLKVLFGPRHVLAKLATILAGGLLAFLVLANGTYRVAADAVLEPAIQQAVVAPQAGYVASASIRAGDLVSRGALLGTLEDRDLELERSKWHSERDKLSKEYRSALASHDRPRVSVLNAQVAQAEAELELVNERLRRTQLLAPFDGIVVSGDLSRSLGSPVERGEVLFEIAPLDAYRVVLQVDETEISHIQVGLRGHLSLAAVPDRPLPLVVDKITPVAEASEQQNRFRVEARLEVMERLLRPGMAGVAKIEIDRRPLIWIWTHRLFDWVKLRLWSWWF
jgi:multidrug resistance efflux pump